MLSWLLLWGDACPLSLPTCCRLIVQRCWQEGTRLSSLRLAWTWHSVGCQAPCALVMECADVNGASGWAFETDGCWGYLWALERRPIIFRTKSRILQTVDTLAINILIHLLVDTKEDPEDTVDLRTVSPLPSPAHKDTMDSFHTCEYNLNEGDEHLPDETELTTTPTKCSLLESWICIDWLFKPREYYRNLENQENG